MRSKWSLLASGGLIWVSATCFWTKADQSCFSWPVCYGSFRTQVSLAFPGTECVSTAWSVTDFQVAAVLRDSLAEFEVQLSREGIWLEDVTEQNYGCPDPSWGTGQGLTGRTTVSQKTSQGYFPLIRWLHFFVSGCAGAMFTFSSPVLKMPWPVPWYGPLTLCLLLWTVLLSWFPLPTLHTSPDLGFWVLIV